MKPVFLKNRRNRKGLLEFYSSILEFEDGFLTLQLARKETLDLKKSFVIRVYGFIINDDNEILIAEEFLKSSQPAQKYGKVLQFVRRKKR